MLKYNISNMHLNNPERKVNNMSLKNKKTISDMQCKDLVEGILNNLDNHVTDCYQYKNTLLIKPYDIIDFIDQQINKVFTDILLENNLSLSKSQKKLFDLIIIIFKKASCIYPTPLIAARSVRLYFQKHNLI